MRAAVSGGSDRLVVRDDVDIDEPRADEVLVRVAHCGICHSDLSLHDLSAAGEGHLVLGHEAAGVVEAVGPGVDRVQPGDKVLMTPIGSCGQCYWCVRGQASLCAECDPLTSGARRDGSTPLRCDGADVARGLGVGGFAEHAVVHHHSVVKLDEDTPLDVACVIGCAVQTGAGGVFNAAQVEPGASVLVVGLGGIGMSVVQAARIAGAARILVSDPVEGRREHALSLGATHAVDPTTDDAVAWTQEHTEGRGADYAFEASGVAALLETCLTGSRIGGTTVVLGTDTSMASVPVMPLMLAVQGKRVIGSLLGDCQPRRDIPRFIGLWQAGELDLEGMISHRFSLDDINDGFDRLRAADGIRSVISLT